VARMIDNSSETTQDQLYDHLARDLEGPHIKIFPVRELAAMRSRRTSFHRENSSAWKTGVVEVCPAMVYPGEAES
jgi:hypothetical protein